MGPVRASTSKQQRKDPSSAGHKTKTSQKHGTSTKRSGGARDASAAGIPGVQKLKASLRQTRRLLAKGYLAADLRVETERRLRSLESDLEAAERRRKERAMAVKYHKVKFFERRKVLRRIKKAKKELEEGGRSSSKEAATQFEKALFELRTQLNYILNYPKLEKYISLFPPSKDEDEQNPDLGDAETLQSETDARREHLLSTVKQRMATGELSGEPELDMEGGAGAFAAASRASRPQSTGLRKEGKSGAAILARAKGQSKMSRSQETNGQGTADRMIDDDFFDAGSESGSGSVSDSDTTDEGT